MCNPYNNVQGYFSLVQYGENPERAEYVNIGVILFTRFHPYILSKFITSSRQANISIQRPYFLKDMIESLQHRISTEFAKDWSLDGINRFVELRTGNLRLLQPRSVLIKDPIDIIEDLYTKLVKRNK